MKPLFALLGLALLCAGCTSTKRMTYDDGGVIRHGSGGAKELVDGVEIWSEGTPPRTYRVLSMIKDDRPGGIIPMARFRPMIAREVRAAGGDAAIILAAGSTDAGTVYMPGTSTTQLQGTLRPTYAGQYQMTGTATSYTSPGYAVPMRRHNATIAIIRYVEPPAP